MSEDFRTVYEKIVKLNLLPSKQVMEDEYKEFDFANPNNVEKIKAAFASYTGNNRGVISRKQFAEIAEVMGFNFSDSFYYQLALLADFGGNEEYSIGHLLTELGEGAGVQGNLTERQSKNGWANQR